MGVTNLLKLIQELAPDAINEMPVKDLSGWRIGIDGSIFIYQWGAIGVTRGIHAEGPAATDGTPGRQTHDSKGAAKTSYHLTGVISRTTKMAALGMIPVYIFDGKPPTIKAGVIAERKERKEIGKNVRLSNDIFQESYELLRLMKIPHLHAPSEAEAQAAAMTKIPLGDIYSGTTEASKNAKTNAGTDTLIDAVATNDIDAIVFGARYMIKGLDGNTLSKKSGTVTVIDREKVLKDLKLTSEQLIDLAILLGSDYTLSVLKGPSGRAYSYKKLYEMIRKHSTIEKLLAGEQIIPPPGFTFLEARREFTNPHIAAATTLLDKFSLSLHKLSQDDIDIVKGYLRDHGVPDNRIPKLIKMLEDIPEVRL
jgi:flap endonuclease-1